MLNGAGMSKWQNLTLSLTVLISLCFFAIDTLANLLAFATIAAWIRFYFVFGGIGVLFAGLYLTAKLNSENKKSLLSIREISIVQWILIGIFLISYFSVFWAGLQPYNLRFAELELTIFGGFFTCIISGNLVLVFSKNSVPWFWGGRVKALVFTLLSDGLIGLIYYQNYELWGNKDASLMTICGICALQLFVSSRGAFRARKVNSLKLLSFFSFHFLFSAGLFICSYLGHLLPYRLFHPPW